MKTAIQVLLALLLICLVDLTLWSIRARSEAPIGCDRFGYTRQATLFRENGLAGINTTLQSPHERALLQAAKDSKLPLDEWYQGVAPHCHHYKAGTDRVILQYPPGTGFLMSLLPPSVATRATLMISTAAVVLLFVVAISLAGSVPAAALSALLGGLIALSLTAPTDATSVAPAAVAAVLAGALSVDAFARRSVVMFVAIGLIIGLSSALRIPNVLLASGLFAVLGARLWFEPGRLGTAMQASALAGGILVGLVPVFIANEVNAGSFLATTYSPIDAALPSLAIDTIAKAAEFYVTAFPYNLLLFAALAGLALALSFGRRNPALACAAVTLLVSIVFFFTKEILIGYYLVSACSFAIATLAFSEARRSAKQAQRSPSRTTLAVSIAALLLAGWMMASSGFAASVPPPIDATVRRALAEKPIVWADVLGGYFVMYEDQYAAKLNFASPYAQDVLVSRLVENGVPQIFVADTPIMAEAIERLSARWRFDPIGSAYGKPVFRIAGPQ